MEASAPNVVTLSPAEVVRMVCYWLSVNGEHRPISGVQIVVEQPFGADMKVHAEVPRLNLIMAPEPGA